MVDDTLLSEQLDYYRARAGEYDRWWNRQGRFDRGPEANAQWFDEVGEVQRAVDGYALTGSVLELAGGTGLWTRRLVTRAARLTVVDGSPEVLAINRERIGGLDVDYVQADLFAYRPPAAAFDACFFSFWLSHVPPERFAGFWELVGSALKPGGRAVFVDSVRTGRSTAADHVLPGEDETTMTRRLDDGREFRIVKRFYDPDALTAELGALGWNAEIATTGEFFLYGTAMPRP